MIASRLAYGCSSTNVNCIIGTSDMFRLLQHIKSTNPDYTIYSLNLDQHKWFSTIIEHEYDFPSSLNLSFSKFPTLVLKTLYRIKVYLSTIRVNPRIFFYTVSPFCLFI